MPREPKYKQKYSDLKHSRKGPPSPETDKTVAAADKAVAAADKAVAAADKGLAAVDKAVAAADIVAAANNTGADPQRSTWDWKIAAGLVFGVMIGCALMKKR